MTQLTITEARRGLLNLPERLARVPARAGAAREHRRLEARTPSQPRGGHEASRTMTDSVHTIKWTETALKHAEAIPDQRLRRLISQRVDQLAESPEQQGKPLVGELAGFRRLIRLPHYFSERRRCWHPSQSHTFPDFGPTGRHPDAMQT